MSSRFVKVNCCGRRGGIWLIDRSVGWSVGWLNPPGHQHTCTSNETPKAGTDPVCSLIDYVPSSRLVSTSCSGEAGASGAAIVDANSRVRRRTLRGAEDDGAPQCPPDPF